MDFKDALIRKGYLPENLPPPFQTGSIADYFKNNVGQAYLTTGKKTFRWSAYNASKRGMTRRTFAAIHPNTSHDLAEFISTHWEKINNFYGKSQFSCSTPRLDEGAIRSIRISSHQELEKLKYSKLCQYRFIVKADISRFYHAIYTHSISWAFHGKKQSKTDRNIRSAKNFMNRLDYILRSGQDGQTVGIPVGPDASRIIAEIISTAIDQKFLNWSQSRILGIIRHVDDVWIGTNSFEDAERALYKYRECIREFELDINENKTQIFSGDFRFSERWPTEISSRIEFALESPGNQRSERLRSAFEDVFSMAKENNDDGVVKYGIRLIDDSALNWEDWETVEPFLKRSFVHFGHSIDYVVRVIVWRHLVHEDLDKDSWTIIINSILKKHARLGNDSEVCWTLFACLRIGIAVEEDVARDIMRNSNSLSLIALMYCAEKGLVDKKLFSVVLETISVEAASGPCWPIILEWKSKKWNGHRDIKIHEATLESMSKTGVTIFDPDRLPAVFEEVEDSKFPQVQTAIEDISGSYEEGDIEDLDLDNPF